MQMRKMAQKGFTLIELMIVVAIIGILALVAVPSFLDAMKKAKKSEALVQLDKIGKRAKEAHTTNSGLYPAENPPLTPTAPCCDRVGGKGKCAVATTDWQTNEWRALDFQMDTEFYFQYDYSPGSGNTSFQALAVGNLDCDADKVTYTMDGSTVEGNVNLKVTEPPPNSD